MRRSFAGILVVWMATASFATAQRRVHVRPRSYGPTTRAAAEAGRGRNRGRGRNQAGGSPLGRPRVDRARPGEESASTERNNGQRLSSRIPVEIGGAERVYVDVPQLSRRRFYRPSHAQPQRPNTFDRVLPGVFQRIRHRRGTLETRFSDRALQRYPQLAAALRRFPDAVLVAARGDADSPRSFVLHGPRVPKPNGSGDMFTKVVVQGNGTTVASFADADTQRVIPGTVRRMSRSFLRNPAVVRIPGLPRRLYVCSDIHGELPSVATLFARHSLTSTSDPGRARWTGGTSTLVVIGDLINKGPDSLGTIRLLRRLQAEAEAAGGRVIVTMGNHEGWFLAEPRGHRSRPREGDSRINAELHREGISPENVAMGRDAEGIGTWLRNLPASAHIGGIDFVHSGDANGRSLEATAGDVRTAIQRHGYRHLVTTGARNDRGAILQSSAWESTEAFRHNADATGAWAVIYGHNRTALGRRGRGGIRLGQEGALANVDTTLERADGTGAMLLFETRGRRTDARELSVNGESRFLYSRTPENGIRVRPGVEVDE